jgi:8-oxo-dGTP pyrophosphatase MutT (NUDIX family)
VTGPRLPIVKQVSSGGVVYRTAGASPPEVALVKVGPKGRWQLPKGIVDDGEAPEQTAVREVREEAGVDARLLAKIDTVEYWYVGNDRGGERVRFHKFVHFFLLEYLGGDVADHDFEVEESRWIALEEAADKLAFESERKTIRRAVEMIARSFHPAR